MRDFLHCRVEIPLLVRLLALPGGGDLLQVGCGSGVGLAALGRHLRPDSLTAVDISRVEARAASRCAVADGVVQADVTELPFPDASFDTVIDFGVCHHVARPADALLEIVRVLKPGGVFVHETAVAQVLAHPWQYGSRSIRSPLPWYVVPSLTVDRRAGLWTARRKA